MIDGSFLSLKENISLTKKVVEFAYRERIGVEGELGRLGEMGKGEEYLTDPKVAERFVKESGVNFLAVAVGTSHGAYKFVGESKIDILRIKEISEKVDVPLVLHGASSVSEKIVKEAERFGAELSGAKGLNEKDLKKAINAGISKINIDTDLRLAFTIAVRKFLAENPKKINPRNYLSEGRKAVKEMVEEKIKLFGSQNKV